MTVANLIHIELRDTRPTDAAQLSSIAKAAKRYWNYPEELLALWDGELTITPEYLADALAACAVVEDQPVAFYALRQTAGAWEIDHLWVLPEYIGRGLGKRLYAHALERLKGMGIRVARVASDPNAEGFYLKMGARRIGSVPSSPAGRRVPLLEINIY